MEERKMRPRPRRSRRKVCKFCVDKATSIDYKDVRTLEKLEEKQLEDYKAAANKENEQFIEEFVSGQSIRAAQTQSV